MTVRQLPKHRLITSRSWLRGKRRVLLCAVLLLAVLGVPGGAKLLISEQLGNQVSRLPNVFAPLDGVSRPPSSSALTFLLVGTDTRSDSPTTGTDAAGDGLGGDRSDILMLARIDPTRSRATVVSIPRGVWVAIPGHGMNTINAAYAFGGPSLLIQTVERLTDVRIDHLAVIDFVGFRAMVDAVGGIDVTVSAPTGQQGVDHLDGSAALEFVRQRHGLAEEDLDRAERAQSVLRALLVKASSDESLSGLGRYRLLDAATRSIGVDDTLSNGGLRELGANLRSLSTENVTFVRAPVATLRKDGEHDVDNLEPRAEDLWSALRNDAMETYLDQHRADVLGPTTR